MLHADILGERARLTPERIAVVVAATGERLTYGQLDARSAACARGLLHKLRLEKGDRLGILSNNRIEFLEVFYAAAKCGLVVVPLAVNLTPNEIDYVLRDAAVRALVYSGRYADTVRALQGKIHLDHWIALDDRITAEDCSYADLSLAQQSQDEPMAPCGPEDLLCLLYTSGTTGRPKGVMVPHRMISWNALNTVACWQLRETDVSPVFTPLYHAGGLGAFIPPIFAIGGSVVLHDGFDAAQVLGSIERERCTVVLGVPTIYQMLLDCPAFEHTDLSHVRWLISGGAPLPAVLAEAYQARGVVLRQGYGLTEVGVNCFSMTSQEAISHPGAMGRPMMFTEARIVNGDRQPVGVGEVGELCLRGMHVSLGYWNDPQATAAAFDPDGFFYTGDLARCDEQGMVWIAGRKKDMFISGGVNVYPPEVEAELMQHEGVQDVAVVGVPDPKWGETGVAFILPRPGCPIPSQSLVDFLHGRLARYKIPRVFVFVSGMPRTAYGKVKKGELRDAYLAGSILSQSLDEDTVRSLPTLGS